MGNAKEVLGAILVGTPIERSIDELGRTEPAGPLIDRPDPYPSLPADSSVPSFPGTLRHALEWTNSLDSRFVHGSDAARNPVLASLLCVPCVLAFKATGAPHYDTTVSISKRSNMDHCLTVAHTLRMAAENVLTKAAVLSTHQSSPCPPTPRNDLRPSCTSPKTTDILLI